jgi:ubiquinone/menaquinone biosynthesis C-methylase UbiE
MAEHVCPVWVGYLLASPIRRWFHDPGKILGPHVRLGVIALDVGPGLGFFSIPLARMVGPGGRVICVDVQQAMLDRLDKRARARGVSDRIELRLCEDGSFGISDLDDRVDFALAFAVVHEMREPGSFFDATFRALRAGAKLLVAEPKNHVSIEAFAETAHAATGAGFVAVAPPRISRSHVLLLEKPGRRR